MLESYLKESGKDTFVTRDPGGTAISEKIREILKSEKSNEMFPETELLLFLAARSQMVRELIKPALDAGKVVICDRFTDSTIAYQGDVEGNFLTFAAGGLNPDLTFFLEIDPEVGLLRKSGQQGNLDRMELKGLEYHKKVSARYKQEAALNPSRIVTIDASLSVNEIQEQIRRRIYG